MRYFFIDLENVRSAGLEGVLSLAADDTVYIFYSDNANNLSIPTLESINNSKATVRYIKINYLGANAMDFQIVSLYGAMIERQKQGYFYIISHDHGFRSAINFCTDYFESYNIRLGEYDNIISALTAELKSLAPAQGEQGSKTKSSRNRKKKNGSQPAQTQNSGAQSEETEAAAPEDASEAETEAEGNDAELNAASGEASETKKRRRRSRRKRNKSGQPADGAPSEEQDEPEEAGDGSAADETADEAAADSDVTDGTADNDDGSEPAGDGTRPKKSRRSRRRRSGSKTVDTAEAGEAAAEVRSDSGDKSYIYDTLDGLLSRQTIDVYVDDIHEAIGCSRNKAELRNFFRSRYGEDESEALYRVLQGDFDTMKARCR